MYSDGRSDELTEGDTTYLATPVFKTEEDARSIDFFFHMQGQSMGRLLVKVVDINSSIEHTHFTAIGNQGSDWFQKCIDLPETEGGEIKVVWEAMRGLNANSHIALDDVTVNPFKCRSKYMYVTFKSHKYLNCNTVFNES